MTEEQYQLPPDFVPITLQRIFDAAWQAFVVERRPPAQVKRGGSWRCRYLTPDGRKCAVGLVLPDGHPAQKTNTSAGSISEEWPELFSITCKRNVLTEIQEKLHDIICSGGQWNLGNIEQHYREVAKTMNLTIPGEPK